ncbi:unnamed protein product [Pleuronectes platessa]|uniref:Uncharacterized protein n=1 Tax=Pleuronectes platessa TaxID=8262 RepID=A0A9N7Y4R7_PLEPL|nr:unnamed protein product [Pleuronectes platessa]
MGHMKKREGFGVKDQRRSGGQQPICEDTWLSTGGEGSFTRAPVICTVTNETSLVTGTDELPQGPAHCSYANDTNCGSDSPTPASASSLQHGPLVTWGRGTHVSSIIVPFNPMVQSWLYAFAPPLSPLPFDSYVFCAASTKGEKQDIKVWRRFMHCSSCLCL